MPLRNRVDPFGELHAVSARGQWMGNRGCLHDDLGNVVRRFRGNGWISCDPNAPGPKRPLAAPGQYTVLFFRDEPTALAAGHVPCSQCRVEASKAFKQLWGEAHGLGRPALASEIHATCHRQRLGERPRYEGAEIPNGAMIGLADGSASWLRSKGQFFRWSFEGYQPDDPSLENDLYLLTPPAIVSVLAAGYSAIARFD